MGTCSNKVNFFSQAYILFLKYVARFQTNDLLTTYFFLLTSYYVSFKQLFHFASQSLHRNHLYVLLL